MLTGMYAVRNLRSRAQHDLWSVNADKEYHEEKTLEPEIEERLAAVFARVDSFAMGISAGILCALGLWLLTMILVLKGGHKIGPNLALLAQFFPGYAVTPMGSLIGLLYGLAVGFVGGYSLAALRNIVLFLHWALVLRARNTVRSDGCLSMSNMAAPNMPQKERSDWDRFARTRVIRLNATVLAIVCGLLGGSCVFLITNILVLKGGAVVGPHLALLGQIFIGYRVTFVGSVIGFAYAAATGWAVGYAGATLYNLVVKLRPR